MSLSLEDFIVIANQQSDLISSSLPPQSGFSGFILQRSAHQDNWQDIAEIPAFGEKTAYSYSDEHPLSGMNYYRLAFTGKNGTRQYSSVQAADQQTGNNILVYPDPASSMINIRAKNQIHVISLKDLEGRSVKTMIINNNSSVLSINVSGLSPGLYFLATDQRVNKFLKN